MQLYAGTSQQFIDDATQNRIAEKLKWEFFSQYRYNPGEAEYRSWQNSLRAMCMVLSSGGLTDHGIVLEYQLPLTSMRLDCMVTGKDENSQANAVIVELKQWDEAVECEAEHCVSTFIAGKLRDMPHPSVQVGQYQQYLQDCQTVFSENEVLLASCSYLHNMQFEAGNELFAPRHREALSRYPLYCGDQSDDLADFLFGRLAKGDGMPVLAQVLDSKYRPSKKLLDHTAAMVAGQEQFVLLDEQLVVFETVLSEAKKGFRSKRKSVILVRGGPGTGKSVIALHLVGELAKRGFNAQHGTGSKAFTSNIQRLVGGRASALFKYYRDYAQAENNEIDVLILDEAHRIRATSDNRWQPAKATGLPQVEELVRAAKVSVFFIDDLQVVRPKEVGSSDLIRKTALEAKTDFREFELEAQFRCAGSAGFVNWVDNTLAIRRTANVMWDTSEGFDFRILDSVEELEGMIRAKASQGSSARLTAGFCWKWSDPLKDGSLVSDVVVGEWTKPWNAKAERGSRVAQGIPKSDYWASDPAGIEQVGCVYTAQGFEFDYVGVIFGLDLRFDSNLSKWVGDKTQSHDGTVKQSKGEFEALVKSTYRVLLTRGMKGCYVYFLDPETRNYFKSRME